MIFKSNNLRTNLKKNFEVCTISYLLCRFFYIRYYGIQKLKKLLKFCQHLYGNRKQQQSKLVGNSSYRILKCSFVYLFVYYSSSANSKYYDPFNFAWYSNIWNFFGVTLIATWNNSSSSNAYSQKSTWTNWCILCIF